MSDIAYTPILPDGWSRPRGSRMPSSPRARRACASPARSAASPDNRTPAGHGRRHAVARGAWQRRGRPEGGGGEPRHLVALRAYVTDIAEFNAAGAAIGAAWAARSASTSRP